MRQNMQIVCGHMDLPGCRSSSNRVRLGSRLDPKTPILPQTTARIRPSDNEVYPSWKTKKKHCCIKSEDEPNNLWNFDEHYICMRIFIYRYSYINTYFYYHVVCISTVLSYVAYVTSTFNRPFPELEWKGSFSEFIPF